MIFKKKKKKKKKKKRRGLWRGAKEEEDKEGDVKEE